jgi:hypothetical protein
MPSRYTTLPYLRWPLAISKLAQHTEISFKQLICKIFSGRQTPPMKTGGATAPFTKYIPNSGLT